MVPLLAGLLYALLYSIGVAGLLSTEPTLEFWIRAFSEGRLLWAVVYSTYISVIGLIVSLSLATAISLNVIGKRKSDLLNSGLYIPLTFPPVVAGFVFLLLFMNSGLVARLFHNFGLIDSIQHFPDIVGGDGGVAILLAHVFLATPFFSLLFVNTHKNERLKDLEELSVTLGSSYRGFVKRVVIPIFLNKNRTAILLYLIFMLGAYEIPLILGSQSNRMVSVLVVDTLTQFDLSVKPLAYVYAFSFAMLVLVGTFFGLSTKRFK